MRAHIEIEEKSAYQISPQMFAQYFKLQEQIEQINDQETKEKISPILATAEITRLQDELKTLNKNIISGFGTDVPSTISQEMIIKWCKYNFADFDKLPSTADQLKSDFIPLFSRKRFLDRLILGKGSKDYVKNAAQYAKVGGEFVKDIFMSGPPTSGNESKEKNDPAKQPFPSIKHPLTILRRNIHNYLSRESNFNENELTHIKPIQSDAREQSKIKWGALQKHLRNQMQKVEQSEKVRSNIMDIIYHDVTSKAISSAKAIAEGKVEDKGTLDKEILDYLNSITTRHPLYSYNELLNDETEKTNPGFHKLKKYIDNLAANYFLTGNDTDAYLKTMYTPNLKEPERLLIMNLSTDQKSEYAPISNTITWLLMKGEKIPDYITREDIVYLFIFDPHRILNLNFLDNQHFVERIGDIDTFKATLRNKAIRLRKVGVLIDDKLENAIARLDSAKIKQTKDDNITHYDQTLEAITPLMNKMSEFIKIWEIKNAYQAQPDDFNQLLKNINELWIGEELYDNLKIYLEAINNHKNTSISSISETLYNINNELEKHLTELNNLENFIAEKIDQNPLENKFDKRLEIILEEIQEKKTAIVNMRNKIQSLEESSYRNPEQKTAGIKKENELKTTIPPYDSKRKKPEHADQQRVLYDIIMTRKSISEGKPTRKYLTDFYNDRELSRFINTGLHPILKNKLEKIEKELINETARNLKIEGQNAMRDGRGKPSPSESNKIEERIKIEIEAETTKKSRQRINHFWVQVMQKAYDDNDMQTVKLINNALTSQNLSQLQKKEEAFSKKSKQQLERMGNLSNANKTEPPTPNLPSIGSIPQFVEMKTAAPEKATVFETIRPPEVKASVPSVEVGPNELGEQLGLKLMTLIENGALNTLWNNKQRLQTAFTIGQKLDNCRTYNALLECIRMLKKDLHMEHINEFVNPLSEHVNIMKNNALLTLVGSFEQFKLQMNEDKKAEIPTTMIAKNMIDYLRLVKTGWEIQQLNDKITSKQKSQLHERIDLIDGYIRKLEGNPNPTIDDINEIQALSQSLEASLKPTIHNNTLFVLSNRESAIENELLAQTKEDIDSIKLNIIPCLDVITEKPLAKVKEQLEHPSPAVHDLKKDNTKHKVEHLPLSPSEWVRTAISPQAQASTPVQASTPPSDHKLPILKDAEYEHMKSKTHIRESMQDIHTVHIGVTQEPANYSTLKDSEKAKIDLLIAESMVRLLVSRCGNSKEVPVFIYDSDNPSRMRAFILVCRAHELEYKSPLSQHNYPFLERPEILDNEAAKMKAKITPQTRIMGKTMSHAAIAAKKMESSDSKENKGDSPHLQHH